MLHMFVYNNNKIDAAVMVFVVADDDDVCAKRVYVVLFFNPLTFESFPINVKKLIKNLNLKK